MREVIGYLRWVWQSFEFWQKMFILAMLLQGFGWGLGGDQGLWFSGVGMAIVIGYMLKWCVWDQIRSSWAKYRAHRNELLTTIKQAGE